MKFSEMTYQRPVLEEVTSRLTELTQRLRAASSYEAAREIALEKEPTGKYLRFYIDRPEGISLDDCEAYHKAVRDIADRVDFDFMEVSSPGIDRPLKKDRDFERNLGAEIEIRLFKAMNGVKVITGTLAGLEDGEIVIETPEGEKRIPRKAAAIVKPIVDMAGIEDVEF